MGKGSQDCAKIRESGEHVALIFSAYHFFLSIRLNPEYTCFHSDNPYPSSEIESIVIANVLVPKKSVSLIATSSASKKLKSNRVWLMPPCKEIPT